MPTFRLKQREMMNPWIKFIKFIKYPVSVLKNLWILLLDSVRISTVYNKSIVSTQCQGFQTISPVRGMRIPSCCTYVASDTENHPLNLNFSFTICFSVYVQISWNACILKVIFCLSEIQVYLAFCILYGKPKLVRNNLTILQLTS